MQRVGEHSFLLDTGSAAGARSLGGRIEAASLPAIDEIVLGAQSVLVVFADPVDEACRAELDAIGAVTSEDETTPTGRLHEIAVRYDGPDLTDVAAAAGMTPAELVDLHAGAVYDVAFLGFQPGFAYLSGLPARLATVRRASPRARIPAGSVAIGGEWTGIYPAESPGGWNLLGTAGSALFDPRANPPALLGPGDRVRFVAR
ncbi:MAG: 5-oxoprolinase subunit PxpB [Candidatus Binatia bacterium]|nr:5-oxoprolinase subunit PxpB [Candidatus Binatia bacterium]